MTDTDEITALRAENERLREEAEFGYMTGYDVAKNKYCTMVQGLEDANERLLAANRDAMLHWEVLKADYERLRAALREVMDDLTLISKNHWLPVGLLDDVIYVNARAALDGQPTGDKHE